MASSICRTLNIVLTRKPFPTTTRLVASRSVSTQADTSEAEAVAVQRIEDAIHRIIVHRSAPDWLPFLPGASYWAPPRRDSYGIADMVQKLSNTLSEEENMSLATFRGWPCSSFYLQHHHDAEVSQSKEEQV